MLISHIEIKVISGIKVEKTTTAEKKYMQFVRQSNKSLLSVQNKMSALRRFTHRIVPSVGGIKNV